jgi:hypothetical protein
VGVHRHPHARGGRSQYGAAVTPRRQLNQVEN